MKHREVYNNVLKGTFYCLKSRLKKQLKIFVLLKLWQDFWRKNNLILEILVTFCTFFDFFEWLIISESSFKNGFIFETSSNYLERKVYCSECQRFFWRRRREKYWPWRFFEFREALLEGFFPKVFSSISQPWKIKTNKRCCLRIEDFFFKKESPWQIG